uniref:Uncharacterized protein n=1 Tax=Romanomermis culicivorax TaxID=13658 RepID=A0A915JPC2_ROMCU
MSKQPFQSQYIGTGSSQTPSKSLPMQPKIPASVYVDQQGFLPGNIGAASVYVGGTSGSSSGNAPQAPRVVAAQQMGTSVYVHAGAPAAGGRPSTSGAASVYVGASDSCIVVGQQQLPKIPASVYVDQQGFLSGNVRASSVYVSGTSGGGGGGNAPQAPRAVTEQQQMGTSFYVQAGAPAAGRRPSTPGAASVYVGTDSRTVLGQQQPTGTSVYVGGGGAASAYIGAPRQTGTNVFPTGGSSAVTTQAPPTSGQQITSTVPSSTSFYMGAGGTQRPTPATESPPGSPRTSIGQGTTSFYMSGGGTQRPTSATESPPTSPKTSVGQGTTSFYISSGGGPTASPPTTSGPSGGMGGASAYIGHQKTTVISTEVPKLSSPSLNTPEIPATTEVKPASDDMTTTGATSPASEVSPDSDKKEFTSKDVQPGPSQQNAHIVPLDVFFIESQWFIIGKVVEEDEDEATEPPKPEEPSPAKRESDTHQSKPSGNVFKKVTFSKDDEKAIRERQDLFGAPGHSGYVPLVRPAPPPAATKLAPKAATEGRASAKDENYFLNRFSDFVGEKV